MKKFLLFLISLLVGAGLFFWVLNSIGWHGIKSALAVFTGWQGLAILGLTIIMTMIGTWKWKLVLKRGGSQISFLHLFGPYLAGFSIMFLAPILVWAGELFRGYSLKERNCVPWPKAIASVIIDKALEWTANLVVIFFGAVFFFLRIGLPPTESIAIFIGTFLILLTAIVFFYFKSIKKESVVKFLYKGKNGAPLEAEKEIFAFFKLKSVVMWQAIALAFVRASVAVLRAWLLVVFLGNSISVLESLAVLGFNYLAVMIPIPAALGFHEVIQTFAFNSLGLGATTAAAFTMIIRATELAVALLGLLFFCRLGFFLVKNRLIRKLEKLLKINEQSSAC